MSEFAIVLGLIGYIMFVTIYGLDMICVFFFCGCFLWVFVGSCFVFLGCVGLQLAFRFDNIVVIVWFRVCL